MGRPNQQGLVHSTLDFACLPAAPLSCSRLEVFAVQIFKGLCRFFISWPNFERVRCAVRFPIRPLEKATGENRWRKPLEMAVEEDVREGQSKKPFEKASTAQSRKRRWINSTRSTRCGNATLQPYLWIQNPMTSTGYSIR